MRRRTQLNVAKRRARRFPKERHGALWDRLEKALDRARSRLGRIVMNDLWGFGPVNPTKPGEASFWSAAYDPIDVNPKP